MMIWSKTHGRLMHETPELLKQIEQERAAKELRTQVKRAKVSYSKRLYISYKLAQWAVGRPKEEILTILKKATKIKIHNSIAYRERRGKKFKVKPGYKCIACRDKAEVMHHMIMIYNGGSNNRKNLVPLCHTCHSEVHPWMTPPIPEEFNQLDEEFRNKIEG